MNHTSIIQQLRNALEMALPAVEYYHEHEGAAVTLSLVRGALANSKSGADNLSASGPEPCRQVVGPTLRWFIVHGRMWGDDDDSAMRFHAATQEEAEAAFRTEMGQETPEPRKEAEGSVYIFTTFDCGEHQPQCL